MCVCVYVIRRIHAYESVQRMRVESDDKTIERVCKKRSERESKRECAPKQKRKITSVVYVSEASVGKNKRVTE